MGCMHVCPRFVHLGVTVDSNALFYVLLLPTGLKQCSLCKLGRTFSQATEVLWKMRALGGRDVCIPPLKMPTLNTKTLWPEDSMRDRYHPKMLLFALDELFYIYSQIKNLQGPMRRLSLHMRYSVSLPTGALTSRMGLRRPTCLMPWPCLT